MKPTSKHRSNSPAPHHKSLKINPLHAREGRNRGVNKGVRTGEGNSQPEKGMLSRAQMKQAFLQMARMYGKRAKGVKKTMSKAAIEQRRKAGRASALKRGFSLTPPPC